MVFWYFGILCLMTLYLGKKTSNIGGGNLAMVNA